MAPVEIESIPSLPVAASTTSSLKTVDKALELPIIHDAVNMATKLHQQATQYPTYNQVEAIVANGVSMVDAGLSEGVKSTVATAVSSLDDLASTGLDKLTTSVPALSTPTEEILPTITGSISASSATDYVASFEVVQTGLKLADTALSLGEKGLKIFAPSLDEGSLAGGVVKQLRVVRRALRAIRHGGRREAGHADEEEKDVDLTSWKKWIINLLHINAILGIFGMSLDEDKTEEPIATSPKKPEVDETVDDETLAEKLEKDYGDESQDSQDPDYVPSNPTEEDSLEYKSDEEKMDASQESQEELEASQETSQDVSQEDDAHEAAQVVPEDVVEAETEKAASAKSSPAASPEKATSAKTSPAASPEKGASAKSSPAASPEKASPTASPEKAVSAKSSPAASPEKAVSTNSSPAASPEKAASAKSSPAASPEKAVSAKSSPAASPEKVVSTNSSPAASPEKSVSTKSSPSASPEKATSAKSTPAASPEKAVLDESVEVTEEADKSVESTEASPEKPVAADIDTEAALKEAVTEEVLSKVEEAEEASQDTSDDSD